MGTERAALIRALQRLLMEGVRGYQGCEAIDALAPRALGAAASLDYALMLATGSTGARIAEADAERGVREALARCIDDGIALAAAIAAIDDDRARAFARGAARTLRAALDTSGTRDDARAFTLITLANT